jgi:hypothetical protein
LNLPETRFWMRLGDEYRPTGTPRVRFLPPSTKIASIGRAEERTVFVATITAISTLYNKCRSEGSR